jgi:hypothetical protein
MNDLSSSNVRESRVQLLLDLLAAIKNGEIKAFNTGGYTGEWGTDGKLAMLHEKELVLN